MTKSFQTMHVMMYSKRLLLESTHSFFGCHCHSGHLNGSFNSFLGLYLQKWSCIQALWFLQLGEECEHGLPQQYATCQLHVIHTTLLSSSGQEDIKSYLSNSTHVVLIELAHKLEIHEIYACTARGTDS